MKHSDENAVPPLILAMAEKIKERFTTSDDNSLTMKGTLYDEFLPAGLDAGILILMDEFNQNIIGAYMIAFGDVLTANLHSQPDQDVSEMTIPLSEMFSVNIKVTRKNIEGKPSYVISGQMVTGISELQLSMEQANEISG